MDSIREKNEAGVAGQRGRLPVVVASSVVRSTHKGESHGGVYLVDLETGVAEQKIDWNDHSIDWEGRGADRGLRGIAFHGDEVYLAASDEIFVYGEDFRQRRVIRNRYLKHCHEICVSDGRLYLTSTGLDSVLEYDLSTRTFVRGMCMRFGRQGKLRRKLGLRPLPRLRLFDPNLIDGPGLGDTCHINNVSCEDGVVFASGTKLGHLVAVAGDRLHSHASLPYTSHNARPFGDGVLLNSTAADSILRLDRRGNVLEAFRVKHYDEDELLFSHLPRDNARQAFGRGLCDLGGGLIAGGSSPATVSVYRLGSEDPLKTVNLTMDVRNAVHGLEIWPF